jgi:hypothetical protein
VELLSIKPGVKRSVVEGVFVFSYRTIVVFAVAAWLGALVPRGSAAQGGAISGQVIDAVTAAGVPGAEIGLLGLRQTSITDAHGFFRLTRLPPGLLTVRVQHIAYGTRTLRVQVLATGTTPVRLALTDSAIVLAPLEVSVLSAAERQARGAGYRRNVVTRAQLAQAQGTNLTFGDVLRQFVPGVRVRTAEGLVGGATCIELRSVAASRNRCLSPVVLVDGVPITNVTTIYASFPVEMIESIEVVPAAEAGARFGVGALYGALLIESRRPGARDRSASVLVRSPFYDWSREPRGHATLRSFAAAAVGNGAGLLGGLAIAESCIGTRPPAHDRIVSTCTAWATIGASTAAVVVPALGGALGSRLGGGSPDSRGRIAPAAVGAAMGLIPGYALVLTGRRLDSDVLRAIGTTTLVVAPPFLSAMADHQFRTIRERQPD